MSMLLINGIWGRIRAQTAERKLLRSQGEARSLGTGVDIDVSVDLNDEPMPQEWQSFE